MEGNGPRASPTVPERGVQASPDCPYVGAFHRATLSLISSITICSLGDGVRGDKAEPGIWVPENYKIDVMMEGVH